MTDVLTGVSDTLDNLTSHAETPPQAAPTAVATATCRWCPETFEGPARLIFKGRHESKAHHDEWLEAKAGVSHKSKKATAKKAAPPRARPQTATPKPKRIAAADSIGRNLARVGKLVANADAPLGRALTFSAPATGAAVDELVAGTVVDRVVIQRFAGAADKWERVGGVIAFPVLIALISRNPALLPVLEDDLREATLDVLIASIPTFEKQAQKERKAVDALARLRKVDDRYATTDDPIGLILADIFGPIVTGDGEDSQ